MPQLFEDRKRFPVVSAGPSGNKTIDTSTIRYKQMLYALMPALFEVPINHKNMNYLSKIITINAIILIAFMAFIDVQAQCNSHGLHICRHGGRHTRIVYTHNHSNHNSCNSNSCNHQQEKKKSRSEASMGLKGGVSFANFYQTTDDISDQSLRRAYHIGITSRFPVINNLIAVHADVLYSRKGVRGLMSNASSRATFDLSYIEVPMMLAIDVAKGVSVEGGVYGGYLIHGKGSFDDASLGEFNLESFNAFDYGYVAGIGFRTDGIGFGARYNYGLRQVAAAASLGSHLTDAKNSALQLYVVLGL